MASAYSGNILSVGLGKVLLIWNQNLVAGVAACTLKSGLTVLFPHTAPGTGCVMCSMHRACRCDRKPSLVPPALVSPPSWWAGICVPPPRYFLGWGGSLISLINLGLVMLCRNIIHQFYCHVDRMLFLPNPGRVSSIQEEEFPCRFCSRAIGYTDPAWLSLTNEWTFVD